MKFTTKEIAITSLFIAIVAVMTLVPFMGMIPLPIVSVNIVLVPILVCAMTTNWKIGTVVSTAFGVLSMINSYLRATTVLAFAIQNPLVSILPRIFIGGVTWLVFVSVQKLLNKRGESKKGNKYIASIFGTLAGVLTNTILFFTMLLVCYSGSGLNNGGIMNLPFLTGIFIANTIPEIIIALILVPTLVVALERAFKRV